MILDDKIRIEILNIHKRLQDEGKLLSDTQLDECYDRFTQRFGIDQLKKLDSQALLETMFASRDSLAYWLEFKNDEEFPAVFGSIAGGSALKFGIYKRSDTSVWMTGSPQKQRELTVDEAIDIARKQRDMLAEGVELLSELPQHASDEEYALLQLKMDDLIPDVSTKAWGHKYFSLLFPDKLDDYHNPYYQRFHLIKLLIKPVDADREKLINSTAFGAETQLGTDSQGGRYSAAGQYVRIADETGLRLNHLTSVLNNRDGNPHRYWRIGIGDEKEPLKRWQIMLENGCISLGWEILGELPIALERSELKKHIVTLLDQHYPNIASAQGRIAQYFLNFVDAKDGDIVLACEGTTVYGIAKIVGPYIFQPGNDSGHRRTIKWLELDKWKMPMNEQLQSSFRPLGKYPENLIEAEKRILHSSPENPELESVYTTPKMDGIVGHIQQVLNRKGQVILYGPPGTGKTYWAELAARELASDSAFHLPFGKLNSEQQYQVIGSDNCSSPLVRTCTFHPAYGYEDFLEGYRPCNTDGKLSFVLRDGLFVTLCKDAEGNPSHRFFLIIDEINRGDIPRIFGELLTVLETSKREKTVLLPLSGRQFKVPKNVYVIGTMNTADRSIALLDTALRRRFGFMELMPDSSVLKSTVVKGIPLGPWLDALNSRIIQSVGHDARNLQIGHSYLMDGDQPIKTIEMLIRVVQDDLLPLMEEYCYEDYQALEQILGKALVDRENQRYRLELFRDDQQDNLISALLERCPEITTSGQAIVAEAEEIEIDAEESDDASENDQEIQT